MKILNQDTKSLDLTQIMLKMKKNHKTLYTHQFGDEIFIYRPVGRKEYKDLFLNKELDDASKEEILCNLCVLFPKNYDFANCDEAGLPTILSDEIIKNSYIAPDKRSAVLNYFRKDMYDLDNQINCMIMEAFPNLDLETIENWDVETTCKYYSRAEWILHNLHGLQFKEKDENSAYYGQNNVKNMKTEEFETNDTLESKSAQKDVDNTGKPKRKQKLTPQQIQELQAKYPGIDWANDDGQRGIDGLLDQPDIDTTPGPLRTPKQWGKLRKEDVPTNKEK